MWHYPIRIRARPGVLALTIALAVLGGCADPAPTLVYAERPCYRTLGEVDCHPIPVPGEESRRVGWYDPPIAVQREPWPQRLFY
jgi:hypothetical protein